MDTFRVGLDLGGTKIELAVLDAQSKILVRERLPTEQKYGYEHILNQIDRLCLMAQSTLSFTIENIGVCTPGSLDSGTGLLKNSNTLCLNNQPLKSDLEQMLDCKISMENDANCLAISEFYFGVVPASFPEAKNIFAVILGTGVGGALVLNGNLIRGRHLIAGEWGHTILEEEGQNCYCGKRGCVETVIAGPSLERYYFAKSGIKKSLKEIAASAVEGDLLAIDCMGHLHTSFAKAISRVINIVDPDLIVVGGGVGNISSIYKETPRLLEKWVFNPTCTTPIVPALMGDSSGVLGAALLAGS